MPTRVAVAVPLQLPAVHALVHEAGLPLDGLADAWRTWVAMDGDAVVGTASVERHGDALLLRSLAVAPEAQGRGVGAALVAAVLAAAADLGSVTLLTETAAGWFERFGFAHIARAHIDPALAASPEVAELCPASATAMRWSAGR